MKIDLESKYDEEETPGAVGFTSGFSQENSNAMGKQITVGQLIEPQIIMTISRQ